MANYDVNYNDQRFQQVEADKKAAINNLEQTFNGMINTTDAYYNTQIQASKDWADKQTQLQNEKTDFAIEQIEQQKEQANKDYIREQQGSYVDWQKQSDNYGAIAEQQAASGLKNSGYSESSQVSLYNTYQIRVATARDAYNRIVLNYNNAIKEARQQNNYILAEIAYEALQKQLELSLQAFQYKNQLIQAKTEQKLALDEMYYDRYMDVLDQINTENALAEEIRQYNASLAFEREQFEYQKEQDAAKASDVSGSPIGIKSDSSTKSIKDTYTPPSSITLVNKNLPIDQKSVLALGKGPQSEASLAKQVKSGELVLTEKNGKAVVSRNTNKLLDELNWWKK